MSKIKEKTVKRFHEKIQIIGESGCWIWMGCVGHYSYGQFCVNSKTLLAHRASWILHYGNIPDGLRVCHRCDVPSCVNPNHLFLGTAQDNTDDMMRKDRTNPRKGEDHHAARLTAEKVRQMRKEYQPGYGNLAAIARKYNTSETSAHYAINRKTWKHVQ